MRRTLLVALILLATGCGDTAPRPQAKVTETIPNIPIPPDGEFLSKEVGEDALKIRFRSREEVGNVATYYRGLFARDPWKLVSDTPMQDGSIALYAEQRNGPPLWVTIRKADGAPGSFVDLLGARTK